MGFRLIGETFVFNNGWRQVIERKFTTPSGRELSYTLSSAKSGTTIFALTELKQVIVTQQFRIGPWRPLWGMPAGYIEDGEDPMAAAQRELLEETGFAPEGELYPIGSAYDDSYATGRKHFFFAPRCVRVGTPKLDPGEEGLTVSFVQPKQLLDLVASGNMTQTDALCAMLGLARM